MIANFRVSDFTGKAEARINNKPPKETLKHTCSGKKPSQVGGSEARGSGAQCETESGADKLRQASEVDYFRPHDLCLGCPI